MSVTTTTSRIGYNGDASTVIFAVPFYFILNSDLGVYVGGVLKTLTTDYSVSGAGIEAGGSITFVVAPPAGTGNVVIIRDPDLLQSLDIPSNDPFPSKSVETSLDKLTMMEQRSRDLLGRTFKLSDTDVSGVSQIIPSPVGGKLLGWNTPGNALVNVDTIVSIQPIADTIHAAPEDTTPDDADEVGIWDSATGLLGKFTLANLIAKLAALTSTWALSISGNAATATIANGLANTATTKLPTIGCTQGSGALTFSATSLYLDFRSTTLTSGAISTVLAAPSNLVLPSGGTLGAITTVQAKIIVVEINNAGTAELAIINIAGDNDLSETGVINTTAISASSTANNVFYSTSARTGVAYRVVGAVDAVNTAGAWASPVLVNGAGGRALTYQMLAIPAQATTSGTSIDFTGIPSWVKRITVMLNGVSTNGTTSYLIQIGTAGGIQTTSYVSNTSFIGATSSTSAGTTGFLIYSDTAARTHTGSIHIILMDASTIRWLAGGVTQQEDSLYNILTVGNKTLTGTLDRIRLTTVNGTDAFDAGSVALLLEG